MIVYDIVIGMVKRYVIRKVRYGCCVFINLFGIIVENEYYYLLNYIL